MVGHKKYLYQYVFYFTADQFPLLIQQNIGGSSLFNRSWAQYKVGFSDDRNNFWIGNEVLSQLTIHGRHKLRFDLQLRSNLSWYWAEYSSFLVLGEATNYTMLISGYSGNIGDALRYHTYVMFSTYDRDNDAGSSNCAADFGGGFWYKNCSWCGVNAVRNSFQWVHPSVTTHNLQTSRMWLMY